MELATYKNEVVEVLERGTNLSRVRDVNASDADFSVRSHDLQEYPIKKQESLVFRDGQPYLKKSEVDSELQRWVLERTKEWTTMAPLVPAACEEFATLSFDDKPFFNQVRFDSLTVVTRKGAGALIRNGYLIYRKAPQGSGCRYEFKSRECSSPTEILACETFALEKGLFIFVPSSQPEDVIC